MSNNWYNNSSSDWFPKKKEEGYFGRADLSKQILNCIKNSKYELPLKKSEIDEIINQAKKYSAKNTHKNNKYESDRCRMILSILDDFPTCSKKTQELIALGLVGLMNIETKYIEMYSTHQWIKSNKNDENEIETFGWEDGIYLSTGDDWDWKPDKERELDEEKAFEDPYPYEQIEFEEKCLDHYIHTELSKYSNIDSKQSYDPDYYESDFWNQFFNQSKTEEPKYKCKADAFNKLSSLIEQELPVIYANSNGTSKELKHNKMLISLYKKLQNEMYKQELRELIRADIYFCNTYTQEIVKDVTYLYCRDIFELDVKDFSDVLKILEDEFELYLKEKEKYESENK